MLRLKTTKLIKQLFPDSDITKIVPKKGCYYVYTKESGSNIYVVVNAYTGKLPFLISYVK